MAQLVRLERTFDGELPVADFTNQRFLHEGRCNTVRTDAVRDEFFAALECLLALFAVVFLEYDVLLHVVEDSFLVLYGLSAVVACVDEMRSAHSRL